MKYLILISLILSPKTNSTDIFSGKWEVTIKTEYFQISNGLPTENHKTHIDYNFKWRISQKGKISKPKGIKLGPNAELWESGSIKLISDKQLTFYRYNNCVHDTLNIKELTDSLIILESNKDYNMERMENEKALYYRIITYELTKKNTEP